MSAWPRVYRERNEIQEQSFKGMIDHGALDINYGRKTVIGPDRHHQRKTEQPVLPTGMLDFYSRFR